MNIEEKTKLAHEYAIEMAKQGISLRSCKELGWKYADAMEAEADKRGKEEQEKLEQDERNYHDELVFIGLEEWQPDWSVAPENAEEWSVERGGVDARWTCYGGGDKYYVSAPLFNYRGDWKDSLRKRPQEKPKQHNCNCSHWKNSSFFMGDTFTCKDCGGSVII